MRKEKAVEQLSGLWKKYEISDELITFSSEYVLFGTSEIMISMRFRDIRKIEYEPGYIYVRCLNKHALVVSGVTKRINMLFNG